MDIDYNILAERMINVATRLLENKNYEACYNICKGLELFYGEILSNRKPKKSETSTINAIKKTQRMLNEVLVKIISEKD